RPPHLPNGYFIEPTIFAGLDNRSVVAREEIFGPVLTVIAYDDEDDAIRIANDSEYGLGGTVWSPDHDHAVSVAAASTRAPLGSTPICPTSPRRTAESRTPAWAGNWVPRDCGNFSILSRFSCPDRTFAAAVTVHSVGKRWLAAQRRCPQAGLAT